MKRQRRVSKKIKVICGIVFVFLGSLLIFAIKRNKDQRFNEQEEITITQTSVNKEKIMSQQAQTYVVKETTTLYLDKDKSVSREEPIIQGAVVAIKELPDTNLVEVTTEHNQGFLEKAYLTPRIELQKEREKLINPRLSPSQLQTLLDEKIAAFVSEKGGDISVYVETVAGDFNYGYQAESVRRTASSIKLAFITYMMTLADEGAIDLSEQLVYQESDYYGGTGIIQWEPFGTPYTLEKLSELVIRHSDNIAYLKLLGRVGEENFVSYLKTLDPLSQEDRFFSSAKVLTSYMKYINEQQENSEHLKKMVGWLHQSAFDDGVATGIPAVDVMHKTGWMPMYTVSNDIALVESERPYYMTIMTSGYGDDYSEQAVSDIAKLVDACLLQLN